MPEGANGAAPAGDPVADDIVTEAIMQTLIIQFSLEILEEMGEDDAS